MIAFKKCKGCGQDFLPQMERVVYGACCSGKSYFKKPKGVRTKVK